MLRPGVLLLITGTRDAVAPTATRRAKAEDLPAVAAIYNEGIQDRVATFETVPRTPADVALWLDGPYPFLVALRGDAVVGWIENAASRARCARHGFREVGIYEQHAQLDGVWRDVVIVERLLASPLTLRHG